MKDIKVIIAAHKPYQMPADDMYLPVQVGAMGKESLGYQRDDDGSHISDKNTAFCELTGLYWAWKNLHSDYVGLAHYRRHFKGKTKSKDVFEKVLSREEASCLLDTADVLVTKKRRYYIESIYTHYAHTLYIETLDTARDILSRKYPQYIPAFNRCMKRTYMHAFNMFIMKQDKLDEYCTWLFDILFELEEELKSNQYSPFHARYPGRVSELLLDVWLEHHGYAYKEVPFVYMEKINFLAKTTGFLQSKFANKKYEKSF